MAQLMVHRDKQPDGTGSGPGNPLATAQDPFRMNLLLEFLSYASFPWQTCTHIIYALALSSDLPVIVKWGLYGEEELQLLELTK